MDALIPPREATLVGAVFNSQVAMARLLFQFSPWASFTRQQAIILDTFTGALKWGVRKPRREATGRLIEMRGQ